MGNEFHNLAVGTIKVVSESFVGLWNTYYVTMALCRVSACPLIERVAE